MKSFLLVISTTVLTALAILPGPALAAQGSVNLTGTWKGTGHDRFIRNNAADGMKVTWVLTQTGSSVTGTAVSDPLVAGDGSCSSCHRAKTGTVSGTVSGTSLTLTMDFPGHNGEVTSLCTQNFTGTASGIAGNAFTLLYTGGDSCENLSGQTISFDNGTLEVVRESTTSAGAGSSSARSNPFAVSVIPTAGEPQSTTVNTVFAAALRVTVKDQYGAPFPNAMVTFTAPTSGASLSTASANVTTDLNGIASLNVTANTVAGSYTVTASTGFAAAGTFILTNNPGAPAAIIATRGTSQTAGIRSLFSTPLVGTVRDAFNNAVPGTTVTFTVARTSNAGATFPAGNTAVTNAAGQASVSVRANVAPGSYTVTANTGAATSASFTLTNKGPTSVVAPALSSGRANQLGIALTNPSLNTVTVTLTARGYNGQTIAGNGIQNPAQLAIPARSQVARQATEIFGNGIAGQAGWVQLDSSNTVNGFFLLCDNALQTCDGGALVATPAPRLVFPQVNNATVLHVVNTGNEISLFTGVSLYDNNGNLAGSTIIAIDGHAGWSGRITDLLPSSGTVDGYAVIDTRGSPFATPYETLVGMASYSQGGDSAIVMALDDFARTRTGYAVHIASGGGYASRLKLVNSDSVPKQVQLTLNGASVQRTIPARGRLDESLDQMFGLTGSSLTTGYLSFQTPSNTAGLEGFVEVAASQGLVLTAQPIAGEAETTMVFSQVAQGGGYWTGLALLNTEQAQTLVTIELNSAAGTAVASTVVTLQAGQLLVKLLAELFPGVQNQLGGSVRVAATSPIYGLQLFGNADPGANFLANIPPGLN